MNICSRNESRGFSLVEVMVACVILIVVATGVVIATTSSMRQTRTADEFRAASFAARQKMEQLLAMGVSEIKALDPEFDVNSNDSPTGDANNAIFLQGPNGFQAGEIILVDREDADPQLLGRDITPPAGPDGVSLCPLPMDFNGNLTVNDPGVILPTKALIGVVIRWISANGVEQRYELWSVTGEL